MSDKRCHRVFELLHDGPVHTGDGARRVFPKPPRICGLVVLTCLVVSNSKCRQRSIRPERPTAIALVGKHRKWSTTAAASWHRRPKAAPNATNSTTALAASWCASLVRRSPIGTNVSTRLITGLFSLLYIKGLRVLPPASDTLSLGRSCDTEHDTIAHIGVRIDATRFSAGILALTSSWASVMCSFVAWFIVYGSCTTRL